MSKYVLKRDVVIVKGSERQTYKKGDVVNFEEKDTERYKQMGVVEENPTTVKEIKEVLDEMGVDYPSDAKKAELQELLEASLNGDE